LLNPNYNLIRKQIQYPQDVLFDCIMVIDKYLEERMLGVNLVSLSNGLKCLLIVFDLITKNGNWRYGVFLPGPEDFGFEALMEIRTASQKFTKFDFHYSNIQPIDITNRDDSIFYYKMWSANIR
jgi:hypothetical protein